MGSLCTRPPDIYCRRLWSAHSRLDGALCSARQNECLYHHTSHMFPGPFPATNDAYSPTTPTDKRCTHRRSKHDTEPLISSDLVDEQSGHVQFARYRSRNTLFFASCAPTSIGWCD